MRKSRPVDSCIRAQARYEMICHCCGSWIRPGQWFLHWIRKETNVHENCCVAFTENGAVKKTSSMRESI